jgi:hypothetical protein
MLVMQMTRSPSTSGCEENPQVGVGDWESDRCFAQITFPLPASRQSKSASPPRT